jgi:hypothetical protein
MQKLSKAQPRTIPISIDISIIDEENYDAVFEEFKHVIARMGHDPDKFHFDDWRITCVARGGKT